MPVSRYSVVVVGGPWDGQPGMYWTVFDEQLPPVVIFVGMCRERGACGDSQCDAIGGVVHPAYWLEEEQDRPSGCSRYKRRELHDPLPGEDLGRAVYMVGGFEPFGNGETRVELREPVLA